MAILVLIKAEVQGFPELKSTSQGAGSQRISSSSSDRLNDVSVNFIGRPQGDDERLGFQELNRNIQGRGTLWIGNRGERLNRVKVILKRSGDAEIHFSCDEGRLSVTFNGRWSSRKFGIADLDINEGFGISSAHGRGRIHLQGRELEKVTVNGIIPWGIHFSAYFRAGKR